MRTAGSLTTALVQAEGVGDAAAVDREGETEGDDQQQRRRRRGTRRVMRGRYLARGRPASSAVIFSAMRAWCSRQSASRKGYRRPARLPDGDRLVGRPLRSSSRRSASATVGQRKLRKGQERDEESGGKGDEQRHARPVRHAAEHAEPASTREKRDDGETGSKGGSSCSKKARFEPESSSHEPGKRGPAGKCAFLLSDGLASVRSPRSSSADGLPAIAGNSSRRKDNILCGKGEGERPTLSALQVLFAKKCMDLFSRARPEGVEADQFVIVLARPNDVESVAL